MEGLLAKMISDSDVGYIDIRLWLSMYCVHCHVISTANVSMSANRHERQAVIPARDEIGRGKTKLPLSRCSW